MRSASAFGHVCESDVANVFLDAGETFEGEFRFAKKLTGVGSCVVIQSIQVFDRKLMRVNVDSDCFPSRAII
jgi:hypothetical protein